MSACNGVGADFGQRDSLAPHGQNICDVSAEDAEPEPVADAAALHGKMVYVAVGKEMVPSRDAFTATTWVIAVCSTKDEARRRIEGAPHLPGSRGWFAIQVWRIDGKQVS